MKVTVTVTVEVDKDRWAAEYGLEPTAAAVREDVKAYIGNAVHQPDLIFTPLGWK